MFTVEESQRHARRLDKFGNYWEEQGKISWVGRRIATFPCSVVYHCRGHTRAVEGEASIYSTGKVELYDAGWLNSIDHYTAFEPQWQLYSFKKKRKCLRVEGSGQKVGGDYWLEITPS